jgi:hypothetical protein
MMAPDLARQNREALMKNRMHGWHSLVFLAAWPLSVLAASSHILLPGGDEIWLAIPANWNQRVESPDKNTPPSVWLAQKQGPTFNVLITPLSGTPMGAAMSDDNRLRAIVTSASRNALTKSVEMAIPVHDLTSPDVHGFYYFATDRAPKPDEWKYLTQGMINIDGAPFVFTILTNDGQEAIAKAALELIRTASLHAPTKI